jgi:hypothetical protein
MLKVSLVVERIVIHTTEGIINPLLMMDIYTLSPSTFKSATGTISIVSDYMTNVSAGFDRAVDICKKYYGHVEVNK